MDDETGFSVGEVARLAHVSVRTLHHHDRIGLLRPSSRSEAGYHHCSRNDRERLQRILLYRETSLGLREIVEAAAKPGLDRAGMLAQQRDLLIARRQAGNDDHSRRRDAREAEARSRNGAA